MTLLAYNLTTSDLVLAAGNPVATLPASPVAGVRGLPMNVTSEFRPDILTIDVVNGIAGGLLGSDFEALQVQSSAIFDEGNELWILPEVAFEWSSSPGYLTTGLVIGGPLIASSLGHVEVSGNLTVVGELTSPQTLDFFATASAGAAGLPGEVGGTGSNLRLSGGLAGEMGAGTAAGVGGEFP